MNTEADKTGKPQRSAGQTLPTRFVHCLGARGHKVGSKALATPVSARGCAQIHTFRTCGLAFQVSVAVAHAQPEGAARLVQAR